ncbi:tetratricopeptide repeat-containing sensor histidine kinase [Tellurirhabdus bombi]|uniref:tetratricopeptide repeat-containing sensor histidine kinase n=1 Tax=Tellurirhabdus bombi TaxID=2907205 RepID=UPI001F1C3575|nr:histidine kinase dimerization/phosphoacceptor domain -containing protein [Tellurirhabdus bombi]
MWTLREIGDSLVEKGQFTGAKEAYSQALSMAQAKESQFDIGVGYRSMGYWFRSAGEYAQAISWYQKSLATFQKIDNQKQYIRTLALISACYDRLNNDKLTRYYLEKGLALAQKLGDKQSLAELYDSLANLESHRKDYRKALDYNQKASEAFKEGGDWQSYYGVLYNAAMMRKNMGQYARSEQLFKQVLAYTNQNNDTYLEGFVNMSLPYALIPLNKLDEAEASCKQALAWAEQNGPEKHAMLEEINGHLSQIWEKRGDFQKALFFYRRQVASHDSTFNTAKNQQLAEVETRYQTREKEESIKQLAAENTSKTHQIWAGVGGLVLMTLLLAVLGGLYVNVRKSRQKIKQQSDQMGLMMKELHHRVKNNLAIVSSLLKLQSNRIDDEKALQAMRVGQQRVEAMALIHQRLYQTDQVTTVNMREYLTDLLQSLMNAYGYRADEFDLELKVEHYQLDVDVAMPIGLIVNELATNAFKYAYGEGQRPLLRIVLVNRRGEKPGITLEVQDNGPGIDMSDWQRHGERSSFGKRLIASLSEQLEGQFKLYKENGTLFQLYIPEVRLHSA